MEVPAAGCAGAQADPAPAGWGLPGGQCCRAPLSERGSAGDYFAFSAHQDPAWDETAESWQEESLPWPQASFPSIEAERGEADTGPRSCPEPGQFAFLKLLRALLNSKLAFLTLPSLSVRNRDLSVSKGCKGFSSELPDTDGRILRHKHTTPKPWVYLQTWGEAGSSPL